MDMRELSWQVGVVRRSQLSLSKREIARACNEGSLRRLRLGWYATSEARDDVMRAVAQGGCLSCISALKLYGVWVPPTADLHVRYSRYATREAPTLTGCDYPRDLPVIGPVDEACIAWSGIRGCVSDEEAVAITDSALRLGLIEPANLEILPCKLRERIDPRTDSGTESLTRYRLQSLGIKVQPQVTIAGLGRVDMLVGDRLILECDSVAHHTDITNYRNDRRRDRVALSKGYLVMRLTWEEVMFRWDEVVADIVAIVRADRHRRFTR
ncbi:MAG: endonuclease domain-containing protein [Propionibacteriaceae bacterium]